MMDNGDETKTNVHQLVRSVGWSPGVGGGDTIV